MGITMVLIHENTVLFIMPLLSGVHSRHNCVWRIVAFT